MLFVYVTKTTDYRIMHFLTLLSSCQKVILNRDYGFRINHNCVLQASILFMCSFCTFQDRIDVYYWSEVPWKFKRLISFSINPYWFHLSQVCAAWNQIWLCRIDRWSLRCLDSPEWSIPTYIVNTFLRFYGSGCRESFCVTCLSTTMTVHPSLTIQVIHFQTRCDCSRSYAVSAIWCNYVFERIIM